jgi:hypothetical protein
MYVSKVFTALTAILMACFASVSLAAKEVGSGPNPFSDCGIGAALFPEVPIAAVTSNIIWDAGTTALTSATASPETCQGQQLQAAIFINETYANVIEETASGQGEHLSAILQIFGCSTDSHASIIESVRSDMGEKVSAESYNSMDQLQKSADFYDVMNSTIQADHSDSCVS